MTDHAREARARRLASLREHPGWADVAAIAGAYIKDLREGLEEIMVSKPDTLTGKTAIAKANRARGAQDILDLVDDEIKILTPPTSGRGR